MVAISAVRSPLIWVISIVTLLITLLMTAHDPPSSYLTHQLLDFRVYRLATNLDETLSQGQWGDRVLDFCKKIIRIIILLNSTTEGPSTS